AGFSLLLAVVGLVFLVWSVRLLLAGQAVLQMGLVLGVVLPSVGGDFAVRFAVQSYRLAAAERAYRRRREAIRVEDCPAEPERKPAGESRQENAAGNFLLDE